MTFILSVRLNQLIPAPKSTITNVFLVTRFLSNIRLINMNESSYDTVGMHLI